LRFASSELINYSLRLELNCLRKSNYVEFSPQKLKIKGFFRKEECREPVYHLLMHSLELS